MSCVAWPNQTPIGTASNFLQCKWVSCSKSYWQGYDLGWYKDMGSLVFRNQINGWRDVHQCRGQLSRSLLSYPPRNYELEKTFIPLRAESVVGLGAARSKQQQAEAAARSSKEQQGAARSSKEQQQQASSRWAAGEQQVSSRWAAGEQQVSSRWAATGKQQQVSSNR